MLRYRRAVQLRAFSFGLVQVRSSFPLVPARLLRLLRLLGSIRLGQAAADIGKAALPI